MCAYESAPPHSHMPTLLYKDVLNAEVVLTSTLNFLGMRAYSNEGKVFCL